MKKSNKLLGEVQHYTLEQVTKYFYKKQKTLPEMLSAFPNFGQGFKVWFGHNKKDRFYIVENVTYDDNRTGKINGFKYEKGERGNKEILIPDIYVKGRWNYEVSGLDCTTQNGINYNVAYMEKMISQKKDLITKREKFFEKMESIGGLKEGNRIKTKESDQDFYSEHADVLNKETKRTPVLNDEDQNSNPNSDDKIKSKQGTEELEDKKKKPRVFNNRT